MTGKAFGKFVPGKSLPLREFEVQFGIKARSGPDAWKSDLSSIQNLLNHLGRFTRSASSRENYLRHIHQFSSWCGLGSEKLVSLSKQNAESTLQKFVDGLANNDCSRTYVNTVAKRLRTFFKVNGFVHDKELNIRTYYVPARYRKVPEYIPSRCEVEAMADASGRIRDRAIILVLWSSGLRVSTLIALNYSDVQGELESGEPHIMIPIYPEMKYRVPDAAKGRISYYTFTCLAAGEALRSYVREREEKYGKITPHAPLFHSEWTLWDREERSSKRLGRRAVGLIVKRAAKLAGIQKWKNVTPHCLRKSLESVLRSPTVDGRMDKGTQEFFMGHILPHTQDPYYDKTTVDFHREEYSKLDFSRSGFSTRRAVDKLIDVTELESRLLDGWLFVAKISDKQAVVRRSVF